MAVKQKTTQTTYPIGQAILLSVALCAFCTAGEAARAQSGSANGEAAKVRLIPSNEKPHDGYVAGLSVTMDPRSHTYWRMPGDAGVPPVFDFSGSENIAKAEILYPEPTRISEEGLDAFGYAGAVTFPIVVTPADASKPAVLRANVNLAVCGKICIPVEASAETGLPASPADGDSGVLAKAISLVPAPLPEAHRDDLRITQIAKSPKPAWSVTWFGVTPLDDIFAEAPEGFVFTTKPGAAAQTWTLSAADLPGNTPSKWVPVTLTLAGPAHGFFTTRTLDVSTKSP